MALGSAKGLLMPTPMTAIKFLTLRDNANLPLEFYENWNEAWREQFSKPELVVRQVIGIEFAPPKEKPVSSLSSTEDYDSENTTNGNPYLSKRCRL
ncbi:uncharacterized protein LOC115632991 [Scaptodrosophila lebanonensis]|uniref:Uncharacterized protein LOC115632991 n=1 Tax=Drosophila lebanonensis TaxID=7225 RepID=A0A6J2UGD6_DROLE|nr:uncharacterized protein LOC115632991 [Scaptodrosophila lebanonensis]